MDEYTWFLGVVGPVKRGRVTPSDPLDLVRLIDGSCLIMWSAGWSWWLNSLYVCVYFISIPGFERFKVRKTKQKMKWNNNGQPWTELRTVYRIASSVTQLEHFIVTASPRVNGHTRRYDIQQWVVKARPIDRLLSAWDSSTWARVIVRGTCDSCCSV